MTRRNSCLVSARPRATKRYCITYLYNQYLPKRQLAGTRWPQALKEVAQHTRPAPLAQGAGSRTRTLGKPKVETHPSDTQSGGTPLCPTAEAHVSQLGVDCLSQIRDKPAELAEGSTVGVDALSRQDQFAAGRHGAFAAAVPPQCLRRMRRGASFIRPHVKLFHQARGFMP